MTQTMACPECDDSEITVEYDKESIHSVLGGCVHAIQWMENEMPRKERNVFNEEIWQWISEYWEGRQEAAQEALGEAHHEQ